MEMQLPYCDTSLACGCLLNNCLQIPRFYLHEQGRGQRILSNTSQLLSPFKRTLVSDSSCMHAIPGRDLIEEYQGSIPRCYQPNEHRSTPPTIARKILPIRDDRQQVLNRTAPHLSRHLISSLAQWGRLTLSRCSVRSVAQWN
jgi:hypothetical protein